MKYILFILLVVGIVGCGREYVNIKTESTNFQIGSYKFEIMVIDGCEYLYIPLGSYDHLFTHKGNCNNHADTTKMKPLVWEIPATDSIYVSPNTKNNDK